MTVTPFASEHDALRDVVARLVGDLADAAAVAERDNRPDPATIGMVRDLGVFELDDLLAQVAAAEALGRLPSLGFATLLLDQMLAAATGVDVSAPVAVAHRQAPGAVRPLAIGALISERCLLLSDASIVGIGTAEPIPAAALRGAAAGEVSVDVEHTQAVRLEPHHLAAAAVREAAAVVASGWQAFDDAVAYAQQRTAFGRPIARFQVNRHALASAATKLTAAQAVVRDSAWQMATHGRADAATAWRYAADVVVEVTDACLQLHGGYGYTPEFDIERAWRDVRALRARGVPG